MNNGGEIIVVVKVQDEKEDQESRDSAVVRADLTSHQCGPLQFPDYVSYVG